jgi:hypothetical protein
MSDDEFVAPADPDAVRMDGAIHDQTSGQTVTHP